MAKIPPHIIDEILQTARIEEVIGEFVNLKRAGSNLKGLSPFTDEKSPSFMVSPAKQIFKCFSTSKGGNVVSFLMEKEHFSYPEALRWLADKYQIQIPESGPVSKEEQEALSERESLHIINEFAKEHFMKTMHETDEGQAVAISYFEERGFRLDIIKKFQLGYCLNTGNDFTEAAIAKGYKLEYLEKVGLVKSKEDRHFDFFRGRVMFPIHSVSGRTLGFGGRTLFTDKKVAKYFNSPESIIYNKSEILYGLYFSKGDIIKYDNCFLCEGYTDVISMYQAGIQNVVASSGTSLTKDQIKLIRRYTQNITILYDGDAAGIKASFRGIDLILQEGMNVKVVLFPDGEDPDSYSKKVSTSELEDYIKAHTQDFVSFKTDILLKDGGNDPIKRAELVREIIHSVGLIPDQLTRTVYQQEIATRFEISEQIIGAEISKVRTQLQNRSAQEQQRNENAVTPEFSSSPASDPFIPTQPISTQIVEVKPEFELYEFDLIRKLIKYGRYEIQLEKIDDFGKKQMVGASVAEIICEALNDDELTFEYPVFNRIHLIIVEGLTNNTLYEPSFFIRHENMDIVRFVTDLEAESNDISPHWLAKHNVYTNTELDKLQQAIVNSIYSFKLGFIDKKIKSLQQEMANPEISENPSYLNDLLVKQINYLNVKKVLAEKLGRIIN